MLALLVFGLSAVAAAIGEGSASDAYGGLRRRRRVRRPERRNRGREKSRGQGLGHDEGEAEEPHEDDEDPVEKAMQQIDAEFEVADIGDEVADSMFSDETFGVFPGPPGASDVLRSAGLAQPGSWTERNVLAAGARDSWSRRIAGTETEADYAVLRAARPGIASSASGYISPAWTRAPWPGDGGAASDGSDDVADAVLAEMGL